MRTITANEVENEEVKLEAEVEETKAMDSIDATVTSNEIGTDAEEKAPKAKKEKTKKARKAKKAKPKKEKRAKREIVIETRTTVILARNLKFYRMHYRLSQEEMAWRTGLSHRGYGKIERCEVAASLDTIDKLAFGTGLTTSELLDENMFRHLRKRQIDPDVQTPKENMDDSITVE